ncbi:MAG: hypothetical protein IPK53_10670, partial [bacterium]|nr:hypothetical protein [bacterium]
MYRPQEVQSGGYEITGQMITPDGSLSGLPFSIGTYTGTLSSFALVSNPTYGGYLAVWTDSTDADYDVYAQRVTTSGILTGTKLTVIADSIDQMDANVTYNVNTNEYLIV